MYEREVISEGWSQPWGPKSSKIRNATCLCIIKAQVARYQRHKDSASINAREIAKAVIRLLYAYRLTGVLTITTDNGSGLSAHQEISRGLKGVVVYFSDSYCSWQNGLVEYTNKLIRQHIPKGTDFATITAGFVKEYKTSSTGVREKNENSLLPWRSFSNIFVDIAFALGLFTRDVLCLQFYIPQHILLPCQSL